MAGGPIRDAKGALVSLIEKFRRADVPLTVYTFNSSFIKFGTDQYGYDGVKERAENIKAGGGTLFRPVVEQQMTDIINSGY